MNSNGSDKFDFDKAMEDAWEGALELIREQGDDPADILRQAAENLKAWDDARAKHPCLFDGLEPGVYQLSCSCPRCSAWG